MLEIETTSFGNLKAYSGYATRLPPTPLESNTRLPVMSAHTPWLVGLHASEVMPKTLELDPYAEYSCRENAAANGRKAACRGDVPIVIGDAPSRGIKNFRRQMLTQQPMQSCGIEPRPKPYALCSSMNMGCWPN